MALSDRQLLDALCRTPFVDSTELAGILGEPHTTVHRSLTSLLTESIVGRERHGTAHLPSSVEAGTTASVTVTITDSDVKAAPGAPRNFTVAPKVRYLLATWDKPTGRITHYEAQFKTTAASDQAATTAGDPTTGWVSMPKWTALKTDDAETGTTEDNTSGRITLLPDGLTPGTAYNVRVRAVNWTATGQWATGQGTPKAMEEARRPIGGL